MQLYLLSIPVADQERARDIYTTRLGFSVKHDIPMGQYRWLTVTSPDGIEGVELLLEPMAFEPAAVYYKALYDAGIPCAALRTEDLDAEVARLREHGVVFRGEPATAGDWRSVVLEDGCGNLLSLSEGSGSAA